MTASNIRHRFDCSYSDPIRGSPLEMYDTKLIAAPSRLLWHDAQTCMIRVNRCFPKWDYRLFANRLDNTSTSANKNLFSASERSQTLVFRRKTESFRGEFQVIWYQAPNQWQSSLLFFVLCNFYSFIPETACVPSKHDDLLKGLFRSRPLGRSALDV